MKLLIQGFTGHKALSQSSIRCSRGSHHLLGCSSEFLKIIKKNSLSPLVYETDAVLPQGSHGQGVVYTLSSKPEVGVLAVSVWGRLWHLGATSLLPASSCELKEWLLCNYAWHSSHQYTVCLEPSAHPWTSWGPTAKCEHIGFHLLYLILGSQKDSAGPCRSRL